MDGSMNRLAFVAILCIGVVSQGSAAELSPEAINSASLDQSEVDPSRDPNPLVVRVQVLLDRAHSSPGVIDGYVGDNLTKAIQAFEQRNGLKADGKIDEEFWTVLSRDTAPVMQTYEVSADDLSERYVDKIPNDYAEMAEMKWLGYTSPQEMLAERFHLDESLLERLNPNVDFKTGSKIVVPSTGGDATEKVSRIVVERSAGEVFGYAGERLIVSYPATVGSKSNPSPSGVHEITTAALDPSYTYNPDKNFQQADNDKPLEIPPGPNGPVGSVWIDLTEPTYGIHGTAEPDLVDKNVSHGCVRLTNAKELVKLVDKGVPVEFRD